MFGFAHEALTPSSILPQRHHKPKQAEELRRRCVPCPLGGSEWERFDVMMCGRIFS